MSMGLLEFARGPALWISLLVLIAGTLWRVVAIFRLGTRPDHSVPRSTGRLAGILRGIFGRMIPRKEFRRGAMLRVFNGYLYHLGLAVIAFGFLPHVQFIERLTSLRWPALPAPVMYVAAALTIVALLMALQDRLGDPVLRLLSGFDDYFSWFVVFLPLLTGMAAMSGWSPQAASGEAAVYPLALAVHLLSVELLFLWLPFGKLSHAVLVFFSRGVTGAALARKGAAI
jgi:nitrate reductase gamma subunit